MTGNCCTNPERASDPSIQKNRRGFTLLELIIVLLILFILVVLLLPATRRAGPEARGSSCKNNLKQIGLALYNYHDVYGTYPPAYTVAEDGTRLHSWRTLILPYVDAEAIYDKIDFSKPWDDPANAKALASFVPVYACPSASGLENRTTYLAVVTPDSFLRTSDPRSLSDSTGHDKTIMIIEVPENDAVPWMSPQDANWQKLLNFGPDSKFPHNDGMHVLFVDGSVQWISSELTIEELRELITVKAK